MEVDKHFFVEVVMDRKSLSLSDSFGSASQFASLGILKKFTFLKISRMSNLASNKFRAKKSFKPNSGRFKNLKTLIVKKSKIFSSVWDIKRIWSRINILRLWLLLCHTSWENFWNRKNKLRFYDLKAHENSLIDDKIPDNSRIFQVISNSLIISGFPDCCHLESPL